VVKDSYRGLILLSVFLSASAGCGLAAERVARFDERGQGQGLGAVQLMGNQAAWNVTSGDVNKFREAHSFWVYRTEEVDQRINEDRATIAEKQREIDALAGMVREMAVQQDALKKRVEQLESDRNAAQ
jgi:hypothetical protein